MIIRFQRMMKIGLMLDLRELRLQRLLRGVLHRRIERCVNRESAVVDLVLRQQLVQIALHRVHRVIFLDERQTLWMCGNFCSFRLLGLRRRNPFQRHHAIQHRVALHRRTFGVS